MQHGDQGSHIAPDAYEVLSTRGDTPNPAGHGTDVYKRQGYPYPGTVVAAFQTLSGCPRYVVESERAPGMLHIFSGEQLVPQGLSDDREIR